MRFHCTDDPLNIYCFVVELEMRNVNVWKIYWKTQGKNSTRQKVSDIQNNTKIWFVGSKLLGKDKVHIILFFELIYLFHL